MPLPVETFVVPADYGLAIIDTAAYLSFVAGEWTLDGIRRHFAEQMALGTMVAWGTGAPTWRSVPSPSDRTADPPSSRIVVRSSPKRSLSRV